MSGNTDEANVAINMNIGNNVSALWTPVTDQSVDEVGQLRAHGGEAEPVMPSDTVCEFLKNKSTLGNVSAFGSAS